MKPCANQAIYCSEADDLRNKMKTQTCFMLGLWHPYKNALETIWRKFLPQIIVPVFFKLFPKALCFVKPKLVTMQIMFSMMRYVYQDLKTEFEVAAERVKKHPLRSKQLNAITDLFEFYLPVVSVVLLYLLPLPVCVCRPRLPPAQCADS